MKKGLTTLIAGILLFLAGAVVVPVSFIVPLVLDGSDGPQFIVPGVTEIEATESGRYYLWNDFQTVYRGKSYNRSTRIPDGLEIVVTDQDGNDLTFISHASISVSQGRSSKNSIGYVEVSHPGRLTVSVSGRAAERVFSVSPFDIRRMFGMIFGAVALSIPLALAGVGLSIWGGITLTKNNQPAEQAA